MSGRVPIARNLSTWLGVCGALLPMMLACVLLAQQQEASGASRWQGDSPSVGPLSGALALALTNPAHPLQAAGQCMVEAARPEECVPWLRRALAVNARNTQAALWLAQIAHHQDDKLQVRYWLSYALERDRSFAVQWAVWQATALEAIHVLGAPRDEDILLAAPPSFRAHFPLLLAGTWTADRIFEFLLRNAHSSQVQAFLEHLVESRNPAAVDALRSLIRVSEPGALRRLPCASLVRQVIAQGVRGQRDLTDVAGLWLEALGRRSEACQPQEEILPAKHAGEAEDGLWNYNPTVRFPLIPVSFDWSVAHRAEVLVVPPAPPAGGLQLLISKPVREPVILLARPLPPVATDRSLSVFVRASLQAAPGCESVFSWEIRDRTGSITVDGAPLTIAVAETSSPGGIAESRVPLALPAASAADQLVLVYRPALASSCVPIRLEIFSVHLTSMDDALPPRGRRAILAD